MAADDSVRSMRVPASPRARRAMLRHGIDSRLVRPASPGGRITEADVLRAVSGQGGVAPESCKSSRQLVASEQAAQGLTSMRRSIARVTSLSAATVPQFHLRAELDAGPLLELRQQHLPSVLADKRARLSLTDFMLRAMALALRDVPTANRVWGDNTIEQLTEANVGLVVDIDGGLLVPVLGNVDQVTLGDLARRRTDAVAAARGGRSLSDSSRGVASSLSNLGTTRVDDFTAVLFPPQSTMLTAGRIVERPFVVDGQLAARPTLRLTLTVDHRVLDGAPAAQFLGRIVRYLENPARMLDAASGL